MQSNRLEIPIFKNEKPYEVLTAEAGGLFVFRRLFGEEGSDPIEIIKLDTAFKEQWRGYLPTDDRYVLVNKRVEQNKLFFLLRYRDFSNNNFQLFSIEADSGQFVKYEVRNFIAFTPTEFHVTKTAALMGGYYRDIPVVMYYHFETRKSKILPGLLNEKGELTQVKIYPDDSFDVLISARNYVGQQTVFIKNYDQEGNIQNNFPMEPQDNKHLIFARSMKSRNNTQLVAGVYGARNSVYSRGLFLASIDGAGNQQLRYYGYGDLQNFFKYLRAKREARIKHRVERRKIKGKRIRFNYRFLVHEIVPYKNQFVLLGEAFYPHYTNTTSSYGGTFFNPNAMYQGSVMRDGRIFDGYRYTHAVVMGFDQNGKLLWDNSFEINDVKTFTLEQFVKLEVQQDRIVLLYVFENELRSKIIQNDKVLEGKASESIQTNDERDVVKKDQRDLTKLEYWYKDNFLVHGVQEISNPETGKRRVFFINKVNYH